jgi:hypothetical protein
VDISGLTHFLIDEEGPPNDPNRIARNHRARRRALAKTSGWSAA